MPKRNKKAERRAASTLRLLIPPEPAPDWVKNTPEIMYSLYAFGSNKGVLEMSHEVQVTREEFIELKRHLAKIRGYAATEEQPHAS